MKKAILLDESDNVATLISEAEAGEKVSVISVEGEVVQEVEAREKIPLLHKIALKDMSENEDVIKYGAVIGKATKPIMKGNWVHIHNVKSLVLEKAEV